jgi:hypothetical protein
MLTENDLEHQQAVHDRRLIRTDRVIGKLPRHLAEAKAAPSGREQAEQATEECRTHPCSGLKVEETVKPEEQMERLRILVYI